MPAGRVRFVASGLHGCEFSRPDLDRASTNVTLTVGLMVSAIAPEYSRLSTVAEYLSLLSTAPVPQPPGLMCGTPRALGGFPSAGPG